MKVVIAKVDEVFFDGEATSLTAPGSEGELTILSHHMPFVTTLKPGFIVVRADSISEGERRFEVESGVLEVHAEGATVLL